MSSRIHDLCQDLREKLELDELAPCEFESALADGVPGPPLAWLCRGPLRFAAHFDPGFDAYVCDPNLGSLGLIKHAPGSDEHEWVLAAVDQATYIRHLLLNNPDRQGGRAFAVELVLMADRKDMDQVGKTLQNLERQSPSYLEAVSVNLLPYSDGELSQEDVDRAFAWLLRSTRRWYEEHATADPGSDELTSFIVEHFRLPGLRELKLDGARIHAVHGKNGSGKSSLVEALEYVLCGQLERIARMVAAPDDHLYRKTLTHRPTNGGDSPPAAKIVLNYRSSTSTLAEISIDGERKPLAPPGFTATAFRLDQFTMDRLTQMGERERAETFLRSFFPEEREPLIAAEKAREGVKAAKEGLRRIEAERGEQPGEPLRLDWLDDSGTPAPAEADLCLPLPLSDLGALVPLAPELASALDTWEQEGLAVGQLDAVLKRIDDRLADLRKNKLSETVVSALEALRALEGWQAEKSDPGEGDFQANLDKWLETSALADLARKQLQLARTWTDATGAGWRAADAEVLKIQSWSAEDLKRLESKLEDWRSERDRLKLTLLEVEHSKTPGPRADARSSLAALDVLSAEALRALSVVGGWLPRAGEPKEEPLGSEIRMAVRDASIRTFGSFRIGTDGWTGPLLAELEKIGGALTRLEELEGRWRGRDRLKDLKRLREAELALAKAESETQFAFMKKLGSSDSEESRCLIDSLNELLALFTPARWAYQPVQLQFNPAPQGEGEQQTAGELEFLVGGKSRGDLTLNTAELNIFTVALYLLLAIRAKNPFRLVVFDDPLQNMDELTVTAVARGLARIAQIFPEQWRLLFLFHGEQDLDRFRTEVPSAVHLLEWMTPTYSDPGSKKGEAGAESGLKRREDLEIKPKIQSLAGLVTPVP